MILLTYRDALDWIKSVSWNPQVEDMAQTIANDYQFVLDEKPDTMFWDSEDTVCNGRLIAKGTGVEVYDPADKRCLDSLLLLSDIWEDENDWQWD